MTPQQKEFDKIYRALQDGAYIRCKNWPARDYVFQKDGFNYYQSGGECKIWSSNAWDILEGHWEIAEIS